MKGPVEVTTIRIRSQGNGLPRKRGGSTVVYLKFLCFDVALISIWIFCNKGQAGIFPRGMEQPIRRDICGLHLDAAIAGHGEIPGSIHISGSSHIDSGMAPHSGQSSIAVPGTGSLAIFPQFHISPGIHRDGGKGSRAGKVGSGHDQSVFGSHIAPGVEGHLGIGFRSLSISNGQIVPGNSDGIQLCFSRGSSLGPTYSEFIDGDVPGIGVTDIHCTGAGYAERLDMKVPGHILCSQVNGTAVSSIDSLAAGNRDSPAIHIHRPPCTLSPWLHGIDGCRRKTVRNGISGCNETARVEPTRKRNVFPEDRSIPAIASPVVFNDHLIRGIRSDRHLILIPALKMLYRNVIPFCGISAPFIHIIISSARVLCGRICRQGYAP